MYIKELMLKLKPLLENIKIIKAQRVTGGLNPRYRYTFSDRHEVETKADGRGVMDEKEIYQDLIAKWFKRK